MTRNVYSLLCLLGAAACASNKPAQAPEENAEYVAPPPVTAAPVTATADTTPISDTRLPPVGADQRSDVGSTTAGSTSSDSTKAGSNGAAPASTDYKTMNADVGPDNTSVNKRDTKSSAVTPMDQGEGQKDLDITKQIRQAVMGDHSLSFTAKNVKIITQNGKVTLRGPVNTNEERSAIQSAAEKVAGAGNVSNQLEVKK